METRVEMCLCIFRRKVSDQRWVSVTAPMSSDDGVAHLGSICT